MQADPLLAPFNPAQIVVMQIDLLRQLFLGYLGCFAASPNVCPKDSELLSFTRHGPPRKQEPA
jgi:hypothetical protein